MVKNNKEHRDRLLRRTRELTASGLSSKQIARQLSAEGLKSLSGRTLRTSDVHNYRRMSKQATTVPASTSSEFTDEDRLHLTGAALRSSMPLATKVAVVRDLWTMPL